MPLESILAVTAVTIGFLGFALVLWRVEQQTSDLP